MCYDVKNTSWNEVSRNLDGDNELIHTLYLQLYEKLFRVAYRMMGSSESAEDLVQQTFLREFLSCFSLIFRAFPAFCFSVIRYANHKNCPDSL